MEESIKEGKFFSPSKGSMDFQEVIREIYNYISAEPEFFYDVIVGCDSPSSDKPFFPIAIVVLKTGAGGRFFLKKMHYSDNYLKRFTNVPTNWKQRILQEVYLSCELALTLREVLEKELKPSEKLNYQFQYIHADVGEQGKTKEMVKEVTGLIKANGFEPRIKPFSFAASVVIHKFDVDFERVIINAYGKR
jgi:predicted RNase H-related nuclease YkuK (DUF458 family)